MTSFEQRCHFLFKTYYNACYLVLFCEMMGKSMPLTMCSRDRYITHFYCLAVEASFYSDVVECLP